MSVEIPKLNAIAEKVFGLTNENDFTDIALQVFEHQFLTNELYSAFCQALGRHPKNVRLLTDIPFLPIRFFKSHSIQSGIFSPQAVFTSSGTTGSQTSRHFIKDLALYEESFLRCFEIFYGRPETSCILGLLPSYLERSGSSLVYMVEKLIQQSGHAQSGFYLHDHERLKDTLDGLEASGQRTILFGVSYALLDFAENYPLPLKHTTVIETGGMKGRRQELMKEELYARLRQAFLLNEVHSEYGMTELLSQAYAINGIYKTPPWMKVLLREDTDPLSFSERSGAINVIDLANIHSCSFIATDDRGRYSKDGFEVLGRLDNSDIRGCSQLVL